MIVKDGAWYVMDCHVSIGPMRKQPDGTFKREGDTRSRYWTEDGFCHDPSVTHELGLFRLHHSFDNDDPAMHRVIQAGEPIPHWERE